MVRYKWYRVVLRAAERFKGTRHKEKAGGELAAPRKGGKERQEWRQRESRGEGGGASRTDVDDSKEMADRMARFQLDYVLSIVFTVFVVPLIV